jgi:hypothetical protein
MAHEPNHKRLTSGQKVGFSFMLVFAFMALGLGMLQLRTTVYGPFINPDRGQAQAIDSAQLIFDEAVRMQRIDTDKDGLNDFEELNFYQTSAYLPDTDSDGISDKKELDEGTDPLCPENKDCGLGNVLTFETVVDDDSSIDNPLLGKALDGTSAILGTGGSTSTPGLVNIGAMLQDPAQLRAALLATGQVSADDLAGFEDDKLLDLAQQALKQQGNGGTGNAPSEVENDVTASQLEALLEKPEELRALLLSTGKMTKEQLDQVDDPTLIAAVKDIISSGQ